MGSRTDAFVGSPLMSSCFAVGAQRPGQVFDLRIAQLMARRQADARAVETQIVGGALQQRRRETQHDRSAGVVLFPTRGAAGGQEIDVARGGGEALAFATPAGMAGLDADAVIVDRVERNHAARMGVQVDVQCGRGGNGGREHDASPAE